MTTKNELPWGVAIDNDRFRSHGITVQMKPKGGSWFAIRVFQYGDLVMEAKAQGLSDAVKRMNAIVDSRLSRQRMHAQVYANLLGRA